MRSILVNQGAWGLALVAGLMLVSTNVHAAPREVAVIPQPASLSAGEGAFTLRPDTVIVTDNQTEEVGRLLSGMLAPATGRELKVAKAKADADNTISLRLDAGLSRLGEEGYTLDVTPQRVVIRAAGPAGIFYGTQTLRQLLPPQIYAKSAQSGVAWEAPCVKIEDRPRFQWRGMMLDVCRHFIPKDEVLKFIDLLAMHKLNTFHWHLTDDQGWRIEIKKYPLLTKVGAWRKESRVGHENKKGGFDHTPHGGFYTQADAREVVEYARRRFVTVVPEIEMPGHAQAAIAAYPELGVTGQKLEVGTVWGIYENIYNPSEQTIKFLQDVLTEVLALFPSQFIHVGGDEAVKNQWRSSPQVQARMKELGLKEEHELQSYFIRRMDEFLTKRGRRLIGWDEILEGGLAPGATVMSWRGTKGGVAAAQAGHDVVMTPTQFVYFDYYQSKDTANEPLAIGGFVPLEKVYSFEPVPAELSAEQARRVLGGQANIWTEYMPDARHVQYMAFPRLLALAEVVWSPKERKDFADFSRRLDAEERRLKTLEVNFRPRENKATTGQ